MGNREEFASDGIYHLYNRGTDKRSIFSSKSDHERFLALLYLCNNTEVVHISNHRGRTLMDWLALPRAETLVDIGAYCLMPNHFHLLVREKGEGDISHFMQKLMTGYTMYFNTRHERSGALMQGKFKSSYVDTDRYLKYLFSYIHLNPVKLIDPKWKETGIANRMKAQTHLENFRYSSYPDYCGANRPEGVIINKQAMLEYVELPTDFKTSVEEWLEHPSEEFIEVEP